MAQIPGIRVKMGGEEYEIPPLSFAAVKRFTQDGTFGVIDSIGKNDGQSDLEKLAAVARVVHSALTRNYPEMRLEAVEELLDQNSAPAAIQAVRGVTFKPKEEADQGEP